MLSYLLCLTGKRLCLASCQTCAIEVLCGARQDQRLYSICKSSAKPVYGNLLSLKCNCRSGEGLGMMEVAQPAVQARLLFSRSVHPDHNLDAFLVSHTVVAAKTSNDLRSVVTWAKVQR
ncbi:hypothetical protein NEOLEDRAFT_1128880 [Neolentinus lepideus HHB14362 ss-1]|uniref:Secreted protein n=1 Tax=Neolentinus lepideus HHB14362 ss-1 TaxID=1314782 RepID=A0A165UU22_9AGAM|nr:hypothetical protein NEOLEDRAFT_1128880 [Neolentinus lepideus HHB14362 ss-1]